MTSKAKPKGPGGRPTKLTPDAKERFMNAVKLGAPYELACNYAGISYNTLLNWKERTEPEYLEFFQELTRAEGQAVVQWLALLEKHSHADAKWAAWKLERRYPKDFGRTDKHEVSNPDGSALLTPVAEAMVKVYGGSDSDNN